MSLPPGRGTDDSSFLARLVALEVHDPAALSLTGNKATVTAGGITAQGQRTGLLYNPPPELMLQTVVTLGEKTTEGHLIEAVAIPWFKLVDLLKHHPEAMHQYGWRKWEEIIAGAYKAAGFDVVILTPPSGDKGRDIIATRDDFGSIRIIEQVKAYAPRNLVPLNDVHALLGVLDNERNASKGIITTTSDFAPGVYSNSRIQELTPSRLELRPKDKLLEWLLSIAAKRNASKPSEQE
jgi:restriction system protein